MRILMIYRVYEDGSSIGVIQKMKGQKEAFENLGSSVETIYLKHDGIYKNGSKVLYRSLGNKHWRKIYNQFIFYKDLERNLNTANYDLVYIRYCLASPQFISFISHLKNNNQNIKTVIEIPTYPYCEEYMGLLGDILLKRDQYFRRKLKEWVDLIVDFGMKEKIFDIPCVNIQNGINASKYPTIIPQSIGGKLRLIAIGKLWDWFGLDRIIKGIAEYIKLKGTLDLTLIVVGEGPSKKKLKDLVKSLKLTDQIKFLGNIDGQELDELFNLSDIAIGTLGIHRKKVKYSSSLKHREYLARRIPFVISGIDPAFEGSEEMVLNVEESDDYIDIQLLIDHYKRWSRLSEEGKEKFRKNIELFSWESQLGKVLEKLF